MRFTQLLGAVVRPLGSESCDAWRRAGYHLISSRAANSATYPVGGSLHIVAWRSAVSRGDPVSILPSPGTVWNDKSPHMLIYSTFSFYIFNLYLPNTIIYTPCYHF